jgi:hypothetical protein
MFAVIPLVLSLCAAEPSTPSTTATAPAAATASPWDVWLDVPLALTARTSVAGVGSVVTPSAALRAGVLWRAPTLSSWRLGADVAVGVDGSVGPIAARVNASLIHATLEPRFLLARRFENGALFMMPTLALGVPLRLGNASLAVGADRVSHVVGSAGVTSTAGVLVGLHGVALRLEIGVGVEGPRPVRGLSVAAASWVFLL